VHRVWASFITPEVASQRNEQGYSLLPTPIAFLSPPLTLRQKNNNQWQGRFNQLTTPGDYVITFKAEDNNGFVTEAKPIILTMQNQNAFFNSDTNALHIPAVTVGTETYKADLILRGIEPEILLELVSAKLVNETDSSIQFNSDTGKVQIPLVEIGAEAFSANLQLISETAPLQFRVVLNR
jgi:hypothetical protein